MLVRAANERGTVSAEIYYHVLNDQFTRLRDGDRFWCARIFTGRELDDLDRTRLSDIIRRNTSIGDELNGNVFLATGAAMAPPSNRSSSAPIDPDRRRRLRKRFGG